MEDQENIKLLKHQMVTITEDIKELKKIIDEKVPTIDQMKLANRELIESVIEKCDRRYASKSVEAGFQKLLCLFIGTPFSVGVAVAVYIITKGPCN